MAKKKKPAEYYFGKFLKVLSEEQAEVRFRGKTYSSKNKNLTINCLVRDIFHITKMYNHNIDHKVDTIFRAGELQTKNSRKERKSDQQSNVLHQLDFYFVKEPDELSEIDESKLRIKNEDYINRRKRSKTIQVKNAFYFERIESIDAVYPDLAEKLIEKVLDLRNQSIEEIYHDFTFSPFSTGGFRNLTDKLIDKSYNPKHMPKYLNKFIELYNQANLKKRKLDRSWSAEVVAPQYNLKFPNYERETDFIEESNTNFETYFEDNDYWFDSFRIQRIKHLRNKLLDTEVENWPEWAIEHIILAQSEYIILCHLVSEIILDEIENRIHYELNTSTDGKTIDLQTDIEDYRELGALLKYYRFPGKFRDHLNLSQHNLLNGTFFKYTNYLVAHNTRNDKMITIKIMETLIDHLSEILCSNIRLKENAKERIYEQVIENIFNRVYDI